MRMLTAAMLLATVSVSATAADTSMLNKIVDQAMNHGEVVENTAYLTDRIGGRLTNSPAMRAAEKWTQDKFRAWGLKNVHAEPFDFGRGWWIESASAKMIAPRPILLRSIPVAWTPATTGTISAPVIVAPISDEDHFDEWRGKLQGKIVLVSYPEDPADATDAAFRRYESSDISAMDTYEQPTTNQDGLKRRVKRRAFPMKLDAFLKAEGAIAWARMAYRNDGLVHGTGYAYGVGETPSLPGVEIAAEDYRRLARLAKTGPVTLELNSNVHFDDSDTNAYNIFAEIPGTDPKAGYVMAGAHLDSWVAADGAADNAAGSAVVMEAARILSSLGVKPKRTIRFALWSGEEQGLHGSLAYIDRHLAKRPAAVGEMAAAGRYGALYNYPVTPLPGFKDLIAYFNMDNGGGKLRGVYAEGNFAAVPVLKDWFGPLSSLGASSVVAAPTSGTDHVGMAAIGLPAFQFIQDPLDYDSTVHHSAVDTFDHLRPQDLRQAAAVMASVLLSAADSDKVIPRNVLPTQPKDSNPFEYDNPEED
ncbi:M20/M25/M40 family metallo-hydrolase [Allosphingosinicella flava]|uniref:Carboxypeptidase Q n=1 Tax=Allosphingosinicella flava TaxID=2771430 RepID=A0A7T2LND9_9SPHN|nr:M20/M25/M40 family metallo-hydrolase [Sphingosinicella flava]QPQ56092.1 M20/M25/M40 family metallo-hydrolase [Sphingosinicella flava]